MGRRNDWLRQDITANLRTKILDFRGFYSSVILILRGGILMSIGSFSKSLSQRILVGIILVGRFGVSMYSRVPLNIYVYVYMYVYMIYIYIYIYTYIHIHNMLHIYIHMFREQSVRRNWRKEDHDVFLRMAPRPANSCIYIYIYISYVRYNVLYTTYICVYIYIYIYM